jgi:hypothetical protein
MFGTGWHQLFKHTKWKKWIKRDDSPNTYQNMCFYGARMVDSVWRDENRSWRHYEWKTLNETTKKRKMTKMMKYNRTIAKQIHMMMLCKSWTCTRNRDIRLACLTSYWYEQNKTKINLMKMKGSCRFLTNRNTFSIITIHVECESNDSLGCTRLHTPCSPRKCILKAKKMRRYRWFEVLLPCSFRRVRPDIY